MHKQKITGGYVPTNKQIIFISTIDEKFTKGFVDGLNKKITKSCVLLQSKIKKNITKTITNTFKKYNVILLCGSNLCEFMDIEPLCNIHVCPITCTSYDDIKRNKTILLSRCSSKGSDVWDIYWKNLTMLRIDEITYPTNYEKTYKNVLELLNIHL